MTLQKRLLLKLSGESLKGDSSSHIDEKAMGRLVGHVSEARKADCQVALVVGGGNIMRGRDLSAPGLDRADADYMGMLATLMNAIAVRESLQKENIPCRVISALHMPDLCEVYSRETCLSYLEAGEVLIFGGGTGSPFFTTDTAATLRALEMNCDALVKLTKVDGVYDRDPMKEKGAKRFERLTFQEVLVNRYAVMDATAIALAQEGDLPVMVGSFDKQSIVAEVLQGHGSFTTIEKG